jgi:1,4-dihydroxy-2-naphthoate octaprenyltransferase
VVPILVGSALAFRHGQASLLHFILALVGSLLVQAGVNFVDEYSDHDRPASAHKHVAPYKVLARGELTPRAVRLGAAIVFGVATLIGIYFVAVAGWAILAVCLASVGVAYFYAGGPKPLGHYGLGMPLVFVFMGVVMVMASYFIHTRSWSLAAFWASIPVACFVTTILLANDMRDLEEDRAEGKATAVTAWGRAFGRWLWLVLCAGAYVVVIVWGVFAPRSLPLLLVLLSLPQLALAARTLWEGRDRASLALGLRQTAGLHLSFGVLFAIGLCLRIP